jgi:two-component system sensor histidine kinase PilS (NtrC family)
VFINIVAFFAVAILSSHLAERLREAGQRLQERTLDLRNLQTLHRDIIANIPSGVMTLDLNGRIISFNEAAQRITGCPVEAVCDRPWTESPFAVYPAVGAFFADPEAATPQHAFDNIRRQDGRLIPVGIGLSPLRDEAGSILGLVVIFQDLTERMRMEEHLRQTDRLAAVGQVAAGIAHEIRNPLAAISGCVQLLQDEGAATARHRRLLEIVLRETERLKLITGQFLDFARPKQVAPQPCPLGPILEEVVALLRQSHEQASAATITLEGLTGRNVAVLAEPDLLKQIYWNICLNALEAMPGGGRLDIRASRRRDAEASWGVVEFTDSGGGIPPDALARLFDPFFTTKQGGTGLGLSIARKITENLGGTITVDNRPGEGATFRVAIPLAADGHLSAAPTSPAAPAPVAGG